jgi:hypothetical protein
MLRCVFNDRLRVGPNIWGVAVARKEGQEHAFILVHGVEQGRHVMRRYDYGYVDDAKEEGSVSNLLNHRTGIIIVKEERYDSEEDAKQGFADNFIKQAEFYQKSWQFNGDEAARLHTLIEQKKLNPSEYQLSGDAATAPKLFSQGGDNCFSFARSCLLQIKPELESDLPKKHSDLLAQRTSNHIPGVDVKPRCVIA